MQKRGAGVALFLVHFACALRGSTRGLSDRRPGSRGAVIAAVEVLREVWGGAATGTRADSEDAATTEQATLPNGSFRNALSRGMSRTAPFSELREGLHRFRGRAGLGGAFGTRLGVAPALGCCEIIHPRA